MIIKGGEPPLIETPEPQLGTLLLTLNELVRVSFDQTNTFNSSAKERLQHIQTKLTEMLSDVPLEILQHLNARGVQHRETKATIGLGNKDNYRMATTAEHQSLANVQAYVNPAGVDQAIAVNNQFNEADYQRNDLFPIAAVHNTDLFETATTNKVPIPYFQPGHCPLILQGDRVILSPLQNDTLFPARSLFISDAIHAADAMTFSESPYVKTRYLNYSWGGRSAVTPNSLVALFRPLANLKKYNYPSTLNTTGRSTYLLWDNYITDLVQGLMVSCVETGPQSVQFNQEVFNITNATTNPTISSVLGDNYRAVFNTMSLQGERPFRNLRTVLISDYININTAVTAQINPDATFKSIATLVWNVPDREAYLHVAIPVRFSNGQKKVDKILRFTESMIFGDVTTGNEKATVTTVGSLMKDYIDADLNLTRDQWFTDCDWTDPLNPVGLPGAILPSGLAMSALTTRNSIKIKYTPVEVNSTADWIKNFKTLPKPELGITRHFSPSRYLSFGDVPERILPLSNLNGITQYLSYQILSKNHAYGWQEHTWYLDNILNAAPTNGNGFAAISPDTSTVRQFDNDINPSLSITVGLKGGVTLNGKAFTAANNYTGTSRFSYNNGVIDIGTPVVLSSLTLSALRNLGQGVMQRALVAYGPGYEGYASEMQIQVYCINDTQLLALVSDGLAYAEGGIFNYVVNNDTVVAAIPSSGTPLQRISASGVKPAAGYRKSVTGDGVNLKFADAFFYYSHPSTLRVALNRPFGDVFGDLAFTVFNVDTAPIYSPSTTNPARLYWNNAAIDTVEELYPILAVPRYGMFQYLNTGNNGIETRLANTENAKILDPHSPPTKDFCLAPAGTRVILGGRSFTLEKSYYLGYDGADNTYFYLTRVGDVVSLRKYNALQEPDNSSVLFAKKTNGVYEIVASYIVLDNHLLSRDRHGSSVPMTVDDGSTIGVNSFFRTRDVIS